MKKTFALILVGAIFGSTIALAASKLFADVPVGEWYSNAITSLSDKGIVTGYSDGTFRPDKNVNRAELAVMLDKTIQYLQTMTTFHGDGYDISYDSTWKVDSGNEADMFYKNNVDKSPSLSIMVSPDATDHGMCLKEKSSRTFTSATGLKFTLTTSVPDRSGEVCKDAFDKDFVEVSVSNDQWKKWVLYIYAPNESVQAEKDLEALLSTVRLK